MFDYTGTPPRDVMRAVLDDLELARTEDYPRYLRDRAFCGLVGRYIAEDHHGQVTGPELDTFLRESAARLVALTPDKVSTFPRRADEKALDAETDPELWYTVSLFRSAIQVIVDDYADTPVPGWFLADEIDDVDEQIRTSAESADPVAPERIPSRLVPAHWWWTLPG